jgi:DNA processing protein
VSSAGSNGRACAGCLRRGWLLSELGAVLDRRARDRARLGELLKLEDRELLAALAGRRRAELEEQYQNFDRRWLREEPGVEALCRHDRAYPRVLQRAGAPAALNVAGGPARLAPLTTAPAVAIIGSYRPSDYGIEVARSLARGLAASGITVITLLSDGIATAAQGGALELSAGTIAVAGGGLAVSCPARRRPLYAHLLRGGCAISELPCDCPGRCWGDPAGERIVTALAQLTVLVEGEDNSRDLAGARTARARGDPVAAVPGRVSSPLSHGPHTLLREGAALVRGAQDVLDLLYPLGRADAAQSSPARANLEPRLHALLTRVATGDDTAAKLTAAAGDPDAVLFALSDLELKGFLSRGAGGRYTPLQTPPADLR